MIVKNGYVFLNVLNKDDLFNWVNHTFKFIKVNKSFLVDKSEYHTTLQYSEDNEIKGYKTCNFVLYIPPENCKLEVFTVNGDYDYCLVLKLDDFRLNIRHEYGRNLGASYKHVQYKPHITLAYFNIEHIEEVKANLKKLPNTIISLGEETIRDLDTEYNPKT